VPPCDQLHGSVLSKLQLLDVGRLTVGETNCTGVNHAGLNQVSVGQQDSFLVVAPV
jgi:hypothetical protein